MDVHVCMREGGREEAKEGQGGREREGGRKRERDSRDRKRRIDRPLVIYHLLTKQTIVH